MNIKRGFDRISVAVSLIALFPGYYLAGEFFYDRLKTEFPECRAEHQAWQSQTKKEKQ